MKTGWEAVWRRIVAHEGEVFHQKRGQAFTYKVLSGAVHPSTTKQALPKSHFEKALERMPLEGPGRIQDLRGPSYIWAILNDPRITGAETRSSDPNPAQTSVPTPRGSPALGTPVSVAELTDLGFIPLELEILDFVALPDGEAGLIWNTIGEVPDSPGLYAFTVDEEGEVRVSYVGRTAHLWMVTKGRLPSGEARGGQRYGRPRNAGITRKRINALVAAQVAAGRAVRHWVRPIADPTTLGAEEEQLIRRWDLQRRGWNRG